MVGLSIQPRTRAVGPICAEGSIEAAEESLVVLLDWKMCKMMAAGR